MCEVHLGNAFCARLVPKAYQWAISSLPLGLTSKFSKAALYATLCNSSDSRMTPATPPIP